MPKSTRARSPLGIVQPMPEWNETRVKAHVHGLRNLVAEFEGGPVEILVGGMSGPSYASAEETVLLTVEGRDLKTAKIVDIEIAIPHGQVGSLLDGIMRRVGMKR